MEISSTNNSLRTKVTNTIMMLVGAIFAGYALEVVLIPNEIIDGGVVGLSILISRFFGASYMYPLVIVLNLPFVYLAAKHISKRLVLQMLISIAAFAVFGTFAEHSELPVFQPYRGELLEIVVIGGILLGLGIGLIIRSGGCLDGTEILGLLVNKSYGISVGTVVLMTNIVVFAIAGFVFGDLHSPVKSFITFLIAIKIMDMVIMGLDEMKSVMIFSSDPKTVGDALLYSMGFGLTYLQGKGGYSGKPSQVIFLMAERLQLAEIKSTVHTIDPGAFIAIENLHEVATNGTKAISKKN